MKTKVEDLIIKAIKETVETLPGNLHFNEKTDTILFGLDGVFDSLGLVTFLVCLEQIIEDEFNIEITIADEKAMSMENSPFKSIDTLAQYIDSIIK